MDPLTDLLDGVRARTAAFCRTVLDPPWGLRIADGAALAIATTVRGQAWVVPDDGDPVRMHEGDVVIVKGPLPYTVADDPATRPDVVVHADNRLTDLDGTDITQAWQLGARTSGPRPDGAAMVASGTYQVANDVTGRLLRALPEIVHVPAAHAHTQVMQLLAHEVGGDDPAQQIVLDRLLDIALVATLRAWFALPHVDAPGWYLAQGDAVAGPALRLMHAAPARPWSLDALAAEVGCSRATFARRFTELVGEPPMTYLTGWRIALAADLLRTTDLTVETIAQRVGYANAFALSVAFKRLRGSSPRSHRADPSPAPTLALQAR